MADYSKFKVNKVFRFMMEESFFCNELYIVVQRPGGLRLHCLNDGNLWNEDSICSYNFIDDFHQIKVTVIKGD